MQNCELRTLFTNLTDIWHKNIVLSISNWYLWLVHIEKSSWHHIGNRKTDTIDDSFIKIEIKKSRQYICFKQDQMGRKA